MSVGKDGHGWTSAALLVAVHRRAMRLGQGMDTNSCVHHMLDKAGISPNDACQAMGRANGYVDQSLKRRGGIGAPTLAEIAQACGYELQLVGRGETLRIDPAPASEAENTQKTPRKGSSLAIQASHGIRSGMARSSWQLRSHTNPPRSTTSGSTRTVPGTSSPSRNTTMHKREKSRLRRS